MQSSESPPPAYRTNSAMRPPGVKHMDTSDFKAESAETKGSEPEGYWMTKARLLGQELPVSGLRYATGPAEPTLRRVLWVFLITSGLSFMFYQVVQSFIDYYERPVDVSISFHLSDDGVPFPAVTVCDENRFSRAAVTALGIDYEMEMMYPPYSDVNHIPYSNDTIIQAALDKMNATFGTTENFINNISRPISRSIFQCYWEGQGCNITNMIATRHTTMGQCFTFNFDGALRSHRGGSSYGLVLLIDIDQTEYIAQQDFSAGLRVMPHASYEDPVVESRGLRVSPGAVTQVQLERVERTFLKDPYGSCTDSQSLRFYDTYTLTNCLSECIINYIFSVCGCYILNGAPGSTPNPVCDLLAARQCGQIAYFAYATSSAAAACSCPTSCDEIVYTSDVTSSLLSDYFVTYVSNNITQGTYTPQRIRNDMITVLVYYPTISYTKLEETIGYTTTSLFNDFGGALGLMLGSTFFTVYEIMDFFIWAAWEKYRLNRTIGNQPRSIVVQSFDSGL